MIEGLGYFTIYPDELMDEHFEGISSHLVLLQKTYIIYGDKLQPKFRH